MEYVDQDDWDTPAKSDWVAALDSVIRRSEKSTILVAHSVGCIAAIHWTVALANQMIGVFWLRLLMLRMNGLLFLLLIPIFVLFFYKHSGYLLLLLH
jgi:hypothetical protein